MIIYKDDILQGCAWGKPQLVAKGRTTKKKQLFWKLKKKFQKLAEGGGWLGP